MKELSLHILDIAENSVRADARTITIDIEEDSQNNLLSIKIQDDGKGMDAEMVAQITDPFITSRTTRKVGLGIPFLKAAAEACNGHFTIQSIPGEGTGVETSFELDHIDRMPMGDIQSTFLSLLVGYPSVRWIFKYGIDGQQFLMDSQPIHEILGNISFSDPIVLKYLKKEINDGIQKINNIHIQETP